jgi:hypothetical protein
MRSLYLDSPGGDVDEAMQIGRMARKYLLTAISPISFGNGSGYLSGPKLADNSQPICQGQNCICASACALIWFGAAARSGDLGLHRPVFTGTAFAKLPAAEASQVYRQALQRIATYLKEMEAPPNIIESTIATDSSAIRWISGNDEKLTEPPSIAEWIDSSCGSFTDDEQTSLSSLDLKKHLHPQQYNAADAASHSVLLATLQNRGQCAMALKLRNVDALPSP